MTEQKEWHRKTDGNLQHREERCLFIGLVVGGEFPENLL